MALDPLWQACAEFIGGFIPPAREEPDFLHLDEAVIARGCVPEYIRSDNGPEFVALAVQEWIERNGFRTLYIKPGAPWQNACGERLPAPSGAALRAVFGRLSRFRSNQQSVPRRVPKP